MNHDRRTLLATFGLAIPFGFITRAGAAGRAAGTPVLLRLRSFEDGVREALRLFPPADAPTRWRVAVGHGPAVEAGLQGCVNDRPFAGFPTGGLRIVRTGSEPGPNVGGVRLYLATVDLIRNDPATSGRPFDYASLPPAPILVADGAGSTRPAGGIR